MSNWIPITIDNLNVAKVAALVTACRTAALADDQGDPAPEIIADVVARIRAEISGCATNVLDADPTTIPRDLKSLAARMIVRQLQSRIKTALKDDELVEQKNDLDYLKRIAACAVPVATPDNPITVPEVQALSSTPRIRRKYRRFARRHQEGI